MSDLQLPWFTSLRWILVVFMSALAVFHLAFVWPRNLTKLGWKVVDYIWLAAALFGLIGSLGVARQGVAQTLLTTAAARVESSASDVESALRFGTSGAICRRFIRTEFSPPPEEFEHLQRGFDDQCAWFRDARAKLQVSPWAKREPLTLEILGAPAPKGGEEWALISLRQTLDRYNEAITTARRVAADAKRNDVEWALIVIGPFLLAVALALRISKVSGELRHELA